jgi:hypothetical protein
LKKAHQFFLSLAIVIIGLVYLRLLNWISLFGDEFPSAVHVIGLMIPMALLFFGYVALRDLKVYGVWLVLSILMILIFTNFAELPEVQTTRGSALNTFKSLFGFLIVFQPCRIICLRITGQEYVTPTRGGGADLFDGRYPDVADYLIFACLFGSIFLAQAL